MGVQAAVKRCMDVVGAAVLVVLTSPLWLGVAVAIRRDSPGPVLFRQTRIGRNGRPFVILKFRTMRVGAEREWRPPTSDEFHDYVFQDAGDLRITSVGNFLRRTSLDELPQLMNVLKGDMSLVGPRPEIPATAHNWHPQRAHAPLLPACHDNVPFPHSQTRPPPGPAASSDTERSRLGRT